jgi:TM2 domain-containing membrane protein YozV
MAFFQIPLVIFILLGQAYVEAAVVKHESQAQAPHASLATLFTNSTVVNAVKHEIEYELHLNSDVPVKDKMIYAVLALFLGPLGCDRCYMGQFCFGAIKFCTFGCCGIWGMIDLIVAVANTYNMAEEIDMLGYKAKWEPNTVESAYTVLMIWLVIQICYLCVPFLLQCCMMGMLGAGMAATANEAAGNAKASMPNAMAQKMRSFGILTDRPTEQEIDALFKQYDTDGNNVLDKEELTTACADKGLKVDEFIQKADTNKDGKISLQELKAYLFKPEEEC